MLTDPGVQVTTRKAAAQLGDIVILAVPWPAMETVAQSLGPLRLSRNLAQFPQTQGQPRPCPGIR